MAKKKTIKTGAKDRKEAIIQAALHCYMRNGIAHTSSSEIAKLAKVDPPLIHYYFSNLEDLHLAAIQKALESLRTQQTKAVELYPNDPIRQMENYLRAPLEWVSENPQMMSLWVYFYYIASTPGRFKTLNDEIRKVGRERISRFIYEGLEKGLYRLAPDETVANLALDIQSQITGVAVMFASESTITRDQCIQMITSRVFKMLGLNSNPLSKN